ncbi:hypothetical protein D3C85_557240 [compost metagenome]
MAADRAGEARGEDDLFAFFSLHRRDQGQTVGQLERGLEGFGQALLQIATGLETVDHGVDAVLLLLIQLGQFVQFVNLAVDPHPHETLGAQLVEDGQVFTFALADHRRQQHQLAAFRQGQHLVDHLADGLRFQW